MLYKPASFQFHWNSKHNFTFTKMVIKTARDYNDKLNHLLCKFAIKYLIKKSGKRAVVFLYLITAAPSGKLSRGTFGEQ